MSELLVHSAKPDEDHCVLNITPESAGWRYVGFSVHRLSRGDLLCRKFPDRETCIVILTGTVDVSAGPAEFTGVESRASVFDDRAPHAVYVGTNTGFKVEAATAAEIALCTAPSTVNRAARLIEPAHIRSEERGEGTNRRIVRNILPETEEADSLLIATGRRILHTSMITIIRPKNRPLRKPITTA
jgi:5-deoxy-glucuronate isomerase